MMKRNIVLILTMILTLGIASPALSAQGWPLPNNSLGNDALPAGHHFPDHAAPVRIPSRAPSRDLSISCNKTTMLVFPAAIKSADRGARYVLAERVKGSENALKVKAGMPDFEQSSLTVITADGRVYVFSVSYAADPPYLVMDFRDALSNSFAGSSADSLSGSIAVGTAVRFKDQPLNSAEMTKAAAWVKGEGSFLKRVHRDKYGIEFRLESIYVHTDLVFLKLRLRNETNISYQPASIDFFIRDLSRAKRTARQDKELHAIYQHSWNLPEEADGQIIVVALPRLTIADDKKLTIQLMEKQGDRTISLDLRERKFRKAKSLYHQ